MDRRVVIHRSIVSAAAIAFATSQSLQFAAASVTSKTEIWEGKLDTITVEYDPDLFTEPQVSGNGNDEWFILNSKSSRHVLFAWVMTSDETPTDPVALEDFVTNDPDLNYPLDGTVNVRSLVVENNDAFGVLYQPVYNGVADAWSYTEFVPAPNGEHRTIELWLGGKRSEFDRSVVEDALKSIRINDEDVTRAITLDELLDGVEALQVT